MLGIRLISRFSLPLIVFGGLLLFLIKGLSRDPKILPSPLVGRAAPVFSLPPLETPTGIPRQASLWSPANLRGQVWLLNVWASWCQVCRLEHPLLAAVSHHIPIVGLAWKDSPDAAQKWLQKWGNPYATVVTDVNGRVGMDYGVYGAPESFLIDKKGFIRWKYVGPLSPEVLSGELATQVSSLQQERP